MSLSQQGVTIFSLWMSLSQQAVTIFSLLNVLIPASCYNIFTLNVLIPASCYNIFTFKCPYPSKLLHYFHFKYPYPSKLIKYFHFFLCLMLEYSDIRFKWKTIEDTTSTVLWLLNYKPKHHATHPWPCSKSKFNLKSNHVNLVAPASPIECLFYLPNVWATPYKLGPERLTRHGNSNVLRLLVTHLCPISKSKFNLYKA